MVGMKTPDVFLNNISFEKEKLMNAFHMDTPALSMLAAVCLVYTL